MNTNVSITKNMTRGTKRKWYELGIDQDEYYIRSSRGVVYTQEPEYKESDDEESDDDYTPEEMVQRIREAKEFTQMILTTFKRCKVDSLEKAFAKMAVA